MSNLCYCKVPFTSVRRDPGDRCRLCCQLTPDSDQLFYICSNKQCLYRRISNRQLWVCQSCYDDCNHPNEVNDEILFVFNKLSHSVDAISYVDIS